MAEIWEYDNHQHINIIAHTSINAEFHVMRTPRRLLEIPGHKRDMFWSLVQKQTSFPMPFAKDILIAPFAYCKTDAGLLLAINCANGERDTKDVIFLSDMCNALASAYAQMNLRADRESSRSHTLKYITLICLEYHTVSIFGLMAKTRTLIRQCLPGSNAYIGLTQFGGSAVCVGGYTECRQKNCSFFECLPPKSLNCIAIPNPVNFQLAGYLPGTRVQVKYGKAWYTAAVLSDRGHQKYDLSYEVRDWMGRPAREAGVPVERLCYALAEETTAVPNVVLATASTQDKYLWPVLVVPLGCRRGIICIDSWANGNTEPAHDETSLLQFLNTIGLKLGSTIDDKIRGAALRYLMSLINTNITMSSTELKKELGALMRECSLFVDCLLVHELHVVSSKGIMTAEMLHRSREISHTRLLQGSTQLIQANMPHTVFMTVFEDAKAVMNGKKKTLLAQSMCVFCSSFPEPLSVLIIIMSYTG